jgi:dethiobiotin synthetase
LARALIRRPPNPRAPGLVALVEAEVKSASMERTPLRKPAGRTGTLTHTAPHAARIRRASWAFATRRVPSDVEWTLLPPVGTPRAGDLILASVDSLGQHDGLQLPSGRRKQLFPGDEIVVAYGNRYASNQFEALIPETLGPCHLVAGGGIAARAVSWHVRMTKGPTQITPIGLLGNAEQRRVNLNDFALYPAVEWHDHVPTAIAVVGTGMDSGKTQSCAYLVRGLIAAGLRVGYAKVTGTGAGGDTWLLKDSGAHPVLDFTDAGMATTFMASPQRIESTLVTLMSHIAQEGVDAMVLEIADGVLQRETAALLRSPVFERLVAGIVLASQDSMGASAGVHWLQQHARTPVLALSGVISAAPLQAGEATAALGLPVHDRQGLATPEHAMNILALAQHHMDNAKVRLKGENKEEANGRKEARRRSRLQTGAMVAAARAAAAQNTAN